jgi:NitT/TauT family transport system substrate-binding protein
VNATHYGWLMYLNGNPAPANALIKRDNPEMNDALIKQAIAKMKAYGIVLSGDAAPLGVGAMTDAGWKNFFDTMVKDGIYDKNLNWKAAYDLRFVMGMPKGFD